MLLSECGSFKQGFCGSDTKNLRRVASDGATKTQRRDTKYPRAGPQTSKEKGCWADADLSQWLKDTGKKKNQKLETGTSCAAWMWRQRCMVLLRIISKQEGIFLLTFPLFFPHLEELIKEPAVKKKCGLPSHRLNFIEQSIKTVCLK